MGVLSMDSVTTQAGAHGVGEMDTVDVGSRVGVGRDVLGGKVPSVGVVAVVDS